MIIQGAFGAEQALAPKLDQLGRVPIVRVKIGTVVLAELFPNVAGQERRGL